MIPTVTNPMGISLYGRRLQYLASTGTQYIDTGIAPDFANGDKVEIRFYMPEPSAAQFAIFGSRTAATTNGLYVLADKRNAYAPLQFVACDSAGYLVYNAAGINPKYWDEEVKMTVENGSLTVASTHYNGTYTFSEQITTECPVYLFSLNSANSSISIYSNMRLYEWKYWHNGTLAQHLIPVLDRSGVPCLYDTISRTLKYNAGTGTFDYA